MILPADPALTGSYDYGEVALFRKLLDSANDAIEVIDPATMRLLDVNQKECAELGYTKDELLAMTVLEIDPRVNSESMTRIIEEVNQTGFLVMESVHRRKDGSMFPVELNIRLVQLDRAYLVTIARNITERKQAEAALHRSEAELREAQRIGAMGSWYRDLKTNTFTCSDEIYRILGADPKLQPITYEQVLSFLGPGSAQRILEANEVFIPTGKRDEIEVELRRPDGTVVWAYLHREIDRDEAGHAIGVRGIALDITERKRMERELRQSEERLQRLIDTTPAMLYSASPDGAMDFFNRRWLDYLGLPLEQLTGWGWAAAVHPDDLDSVQSKWRSTLATGAPFEQEMRVRGADGQYRWFLIRKEPVRDPQGSVVKWYGSGIDIEDRKRAENESRRQKELFQKIFENAPVMIAFFDEARKYELVNPEWERTTGWTLQEIREGKVDVFSELFPDPQYRQTILDRLDTSNDDRYEVKVKARNGSVIDVGGRLVRLSDGSRIAIGRDVTELKRAQDALLEAQEKLARITRVTALGQLAVAIAHEVNQPLAAIVTNGNFCLRQLAGGTPNLNEMQATIKEIVDDGTRASEVISRIRGMLVKRYPLRTELDVNRLICDTILLLRNELARNRVCLRTEIAPDLPHVLGDPVQLQQVLINLLMNAVEALRTSRNGLREILIRSAKDADNVLVQVQDSGPGIDSEVADRIFEPFFTTKPESIGMGLSISRSIVESHGGHLSFVKTSAGTTFQFTLPVSHDGAE